MRPDAAPQGSPTLKNPIRNDYGPALWKVEPAQITFVKDARGRITGGIHEQGGRKLDVPRIE
jgi:hypothetical protein